MKKVVCCSKLGWCGRQIILMAPAAATFGGTEKQQRKEAECYAWVRFRGVQLSPERALSSADLAVEGAEAPARLAPAFAAGFFFASALTGGAGAPGATPFTRTSLGFCNASEAER